MTFAMMWVHEDSILATADTVVSRPTSHAVVSGPTALGQRDEFKGLEVNEGAMKLAMLPRNVLVVGAGEQAAVVATIQAIERLLNLGTDPQALADRLATTIVQQAEAHVLIGFSGGAGPCISEFQVDRSRGPTVRHHRQGAYIAGSLPDSICKGMLWGAKEGAIGMKPDSALIAAQTTMHIAMSLEPRLHRNGIGGVLCGARVGPSGITPQPSTVWLFTSDSFEPTGIVVSSVGQNLHYVRSSYYGDGHESIFVGIPSSITDDAVNEWGHEQQRTLPETVVFLNLQRRSAVVVASTSALGSPIRYTPHPQSLSLTTDSATFIRERLLEPVPPQGVSILLYRWWEDATR
jgi:hypothetical protein